MVKYGRINEEIERLLKTNVVIVLTACERYQQYICFKGTKKDEYPYLKVARARITPSDVLLIPNPMDVTVNYADMDFLGGRMVERNASKREMTAYIDFLKNNNPFNEEPKKK